MQRLISLALLLGLAGGGWSLFGNGQRDLRDVVRGVTTALGNARSGPPSPGLGQDVTPGFMPPPAQRGEPTIRIGTFNIQVFGDKKASKSGVMDALARVVRRHDVIAIQEIRTQDPYFIARFLRDYVNREGAVYDARVSPRLGRTVSKEQYAFLFNTATIDVHPTFCGLVPDPEDRLHREPYAAAFRTRINAPYTPFTFTLINVHTDPDEVAEELDALYYAYRAVQRSVIEGAVEDDVILLGDLNTNVQVGQQRSLTPSDLGLLAHTPGLTPLVLRTATNTRGTRLHDNLLIPIRATLEYRDHGVMDLRTALDYSLTLEQALEVSDHLPVWGEFSAIEADAYRTAARP